ncbi:MAG: polynucleotide adenylyltransferase PcnB [Planctomycetota bacterium]|nr:MAG: polynucleotide adenylyltransferase PcnB [Planctomycetota bacterium]
MTRHTPNEEHRTPRPPGRKPIRAEIDEGALDRDALRVVTRLQHHGYEAYFVGGCVRDLLIGRDPKDYDVATSAHPRDIKRIFRNGRIIGRRFRLVHIYYGDNIIETATFRADPQPGPDDNGAEGDLLIVEDNEFGTAEEDARRRDFTVNGLFLDPETNRILDYVDGMRDLEHRVLRTIGDPEVRLAEDPVRILRAIKFATRLDFRIEDQTWAAMTALSGHLSRAAPPRVLEEIMRLLRSGTALGAFRMLRACGALAVLLPQIDEYLGPRETPDRAAVERAGHFWRLLEALDAEVHRGYEPSSAVCIAVMFLHIIEREADAETRTLPGAPGEIGDVCWEVIDELSTTARLSRRDFGRARRIIVQQSRFTLPKSNRFSPLLFTLTEDFPESLELFGLRVEARGQGWDIYEGWRDRFNRAKSASDEDLEAERRSVRKRRRPRRRKRRGRR